MSRLEEIAAQWHRNSLCITKADVGWIIAECEQLRAEVVRLTEEVQEMTDSYRSACEDFWLTYKAGMSLTDDGGESLAPKDKPWTDVERRVEALNDENGRLREERDRLAAVVVS